MQLFESAKKGFLHHVLGVLFVASHTKCETEDGAAVPLYKDTKGQLIPFARFFGSRSISPIHPGCSLD
jgi:hypothetical protein